MVLGVVTTPLAFIYILNDFLYFSSLFLPILRNLKGLLMAEEYIIGSENTRGGWRNGGRKKGVKLKPETVVFYKRVTPEEKEFLENCLADFRNRNKSL